MAVIELSKEETNSFFYRHPFFWLDYGMSTWTDGESIFDSTLNGYVVFRNVNGQAILFWTDENPGSVGTIAAIVDVFKKEVMGTNPDGNAKSLPDVSSWLYWIVAILILFAVIQSGILKRIG
jgi:hypothetical protein